MERPPAAVLAAFHIEDEPVRLLGGRGTSYRAGDAVLKPVDDVAEAEWMADLFQHLPEHHFRRIMEINCIYQHSGSADLHDIEAYGPLLAAISRR